LKVEGSLVLGFAGTSDALVFGIAFKIIDEFREPARQSERSFKQQIEFFLVNVFLIFSNRARIAEGAEPSTFNFQPSTIF